MMFGMALSEEMTSAWVQAVVGFVGVLVGSVVAWIGDAKRSRDSRLYDRRVRQLDEMCDLVDALEALDRAPYDGTMRAELDQQGVVGAVDTQGILGWQSRKADALITRAWRYRCAQDHDVESEMQRLQDIWDRGTEVSAGIERHAIVPSEGPPGTEQPDVPDASAELSETEWMQGMIASARRCVDRAREALDEDGPPWWRRWAAVGLVAVLVAAVGLVVR